MFKVLHHIIYNCHELLSLSHKIKRVQHQSKGFCGLRKIWQVNIDFGSTEKDKIMKVVIDHF